MTRFPNTTSRESVLLGCSDRDLCPVQGQASLSPLTNANPAGFTTPGLPAKIPACLDLPDKETGPETMSQSPTRLVVRKEAGLPTPVLCGLRTPI